MLIEDNRSSSNFSCFVRHCPCSSTSHNSSSATLRLCALAGAFFSCFLCERRRRRWRLPESPAAVILASIQPCMYIYMYSSLRTHAHCSPSPQSEWKIQKQQFHPGERVDVVLGFALYVCTYELSELVCSAPLSRPLFPDFNQKRLMQNVFKPSFEHLRWLLFTLTPGQPESGFRLLSAESTSPGCVFAPLQQQPNQGRECFYARPNTSQ